MGATANSLIDSRRLTGPNLISQTQGAVIDVALGDTPAQRVIETWRRNVQRVLAAVGWDGAELAARSFPGGASLLMAAPIDALYAATEVNEWAWAATQAALAGGDEPDLEVEAARLRALISAERNPKLLSLRDAAAERGVCFVSDDDQASVGMGAGSLTWPTDALPAAGDVPWERVHDIPVALVTGSNGKTTTVRLLAAMVSAAGHVPGYCNTDGIYIGDQLVDADDWSGPGGARRVLRDPRAAVAILETARGGILRRGLAVQRTDAAIVTNVAADHLGEFGVHDVEAIADAKLVVARAVRGDGDLALNADDPVLAARASALPVRPGWISLDADLPLLLEHVEAGGSATVIEDGAFVRIEAGTRTTLVAVGDVPITFGGAARYNIYNALGAIAVARALGIGFDAIRAGLLAFTSSPETNPGRGNLYELGEVRILVDFAHNPHGLRALFEMAAQMPARRRLVALGQAGDRDDEAIRQLGLLAAEWRFDRVITKELAPKYLRGRKEGEVTALIESALLEGGFSADAIDRASSELESVRAALEWAAPGDLLVLPILSSRDAVLAYLSRLRDEGWRPGTAPPD